MSGGGSGGGGSQTVTQVQQIPEFEQQFAQENQDLSRSLAGTPYSSVQYMGNTPQSVIDAFQSAQNTYNNAKQISQQTGVPIDPAIQAGMDQAQANYNAYRQANTPIAGFTDMQQQGLQQAGQAANAYVPYMSAANTFSGIGYNQAMPTMQNAVGMAQGALQPSQQGFAGAGNLIGQGAGLTGGATGALAPYLQQATGLAQQATGSFQPNLAAANAMTMNAASGWGNAAPAEQASYMNPYVMQALAPQLQQLQLQQQQNQRNIDASATQAGAFGDARQGAATALNNFFSGLQQQDVIGQGMSNAYNTGLNAYQADQSRGLAAGAQMGNLGSIGQQLQLNPASLLANLGNMNSGIQLQAGAQLGNLGSQMGNVANQQGQLNLAQAGLEGQLAQQQQNMGLNQATFAAGMGNQMQQLGVQGANTLFDAGAQQQQLNQQLQNYNYQQWQNQANWPFQMLNMRESALSNSPYTIANSTTLPAANMTAQNLGAFGALAGGVGSLLNGGGSTSPFGGTKLQ